jgi:two-component system CheB/CheR fusion protein
MLTHSKNRRDAIAPLVRAKQTNDPVRVWVPGCSSGEEAHSIAMLLREELEAAQKRCDLQVFAADIDDESLQIARTGIFPESIVAGVGTDRLSRFFVRKGGGYQVIESLRGSIVFAAQNLWMFSLPLRCNLGRPSRGRAKV